MPCGCAGDLDESDRTADAVGIWPPTPVEHNHTASPVREMREDAGHRAARPPGSCRMHTDFHTAAGAPSGGRLRSPGADRTKLPRVLDVLRGERVMPWCDVLEIDEGSEASATRSAACGRVMP